jgi:hypothetical protein
VLIRIEVALVTPSDLGLLLAGADVITAASAGTSATVAHATGSEPPMAKMPVPVGKAVDPSRNSPSSDSITAVNAITPSGVHRVGLSLVWAERVC